MPCNAIPVGTTADVARGRECYLKCATDMNNCLMGCGFDPLG